jgi:hypothetical protein
MFNVDGSKMLVAGYKTVYSFQQLQTFPRIPRATLLCFDV